MRKEDAIYVIEAEFCNGKRYKNSQQFKEDAVQYRLDHPELPLRKAAENLGVSESALKNWMKAAKEHKGEVPTRGSGNYAIINILGDKRV